MIRGSVKERSSKELNKKLIRAAFRGDAKKIRELLGQGANVDHKDSEFTSSALTIAMRHMFTDAVKELLANAATLSNEETEIKSSIAFTKDNLFKTVSREWEAGKIVGNSPEEVMITLINAKNNEDLFMMLEESYMTIMTLLMTLQKSNEKLKLVLDAKILHALVNDVLDVLAEQAKLTVKRKESLRKQLFKNLYPNLEIIINNISDEPSRLNLIKDINEQILKQAGQIPAGSDIYMDIQLHKSFILSEIVNAELMQVNDLKKYIANFMPAFQTYTQTAAISENKDNRDENAERLKM